ncbi:hypothetical protein [Mycolicibacterium bacteremicum]|uniref:hypothetical protein n=1 Tax=Mycolicibacterium bacteremicum TaxID=564198 RepID=UPI0026EC7C2B|nr:hypothetical protein [Mycolicibacterium bacteremicum]
MTDDLPDAPHPEGVRLIDARLHLLDRQLVDDSGEPVGIVDDVEIQADDPERPVVTAILTGQVLFTRIFGGRPPRERLQALGWHDVDRIGTSIHLRPGADVTENQWVEHWLRDRIIGRIPGGRHAAE